MEDIIETTDEGMIRIIFEKTDGINSYRDALYFTQEDYSLLVQFDIEALKQARFDNWISIITGVTEEVLAEEPIVTEEVPVEEPVLVTEEVPVEEPVLVTEEVPVDQPIVTEEVPVDQPALAEDVVVDQPVVTEDVVV